MEALVAIIKMPILIYTILVGIAILYWCIAAVGAIDIDILDFSPELDVDADFDLDMDPNLSRHGTHDGFDGVLDFLNFGKVPMTIIGTAVIFKLWILAYIFHYAVPLQEYIAIPAILWHILFVVIAIFASLLLTGFTTRPLRKLFNVETVHGHAHLIGQECTVKSINVTPTNGQAELWIEGSMILISAKCLEENSLTKGDKAIIMNYNTEKDFYIIEPKAKLEGDL